MYLKLQCEGRRDWGETGRSASLLDSQSGQIVELQVQWEIQSQKHHGEYWGINLLSTSDLYMQNHTYAHVHTPHSCMPPTHTKDITLIFMWNLLYILPWFANQTYSQQHSHSYMINSQLSSVFLHKDTACHHQLGVSTIHLGNIKGQNYQPSHNTVQTTAGMYTSGKDSGWQPESQDKEQIIILFSLGWEQVHWTTQVL